MDAAAQAFRKHHGWCERSLGWRCHATSYRCGTGYSLSEVRIGSQRRPDTKAALRRGRIRLGFRLLRLGETRHGFLKASTWAAPAIRPRGEFRMDRGHVVC